MKQPFTYTIVTQDQHMIEIIAPRNEIFEMLLKNSRNGEGFANNKVVNGNYYATLCTKNMSHPSGRQGEWEKFLLQVDKYNTNLEFDNKFEKLLKD